MKLKNKSSVIFIVLAFLLISFFVAKAVNDSYNKPIIPPASFIKQGEVRTLIETTDKYFYKIENFTENGAYATPAIERQLTYKEYALMKANKSYDIYEVKKEMILKNKYLEIVNRFLPDNKPLLGNYVGEIIDGSFTPIKFTDTKERRTICIQEDGTFYIATKFLDSEGNYTKDATIIMVTEEQYREKILSEEFDYEVISDYQVESNQMLYVTAFYDSKGDQIKRPIIIHLTGFTNIEDYIKEKVPDIDIDNPEDTDPDTDIDIDNPEDTDPEDKDKDDKDEQGGAGLEPTAPPEPWLGDMYSWNDNGYFVEDSSFTWSDDYWNSVGGIGDWSDNDLDNQSGEGGYQDPFDKGKYGYVDDSGQFIETDKDGNVKPSEPGEFDAGGNFHPDDEDAYYDPDGVKHPKPEDSEGGHYDEDGNFHPDGTDGYFDPEGNWHPGKDEQGVLDENGNIVMPDGTVITPDGKVGYYDEDGNFVEGESPYEGGYYDKDGNWIEDGTSSTDKAGYYDKDGNFVLEDGSGYFDKDGVFHPSGEGTKDKIDSEGKTITEGKGTITIDENGNIVVVGEEGYYDENGLVHLPDGRVGYYDEYGNFIESNTNPNAADGGFYDASGDFHSFNEVYKDSNDSTQVVKEPDMGLSTKGDKLLIEGQDGEYGADGLVTLPDGKVGYYDEDGNFIESNKNPHKGGFYDEEGNWVDDSLYSLDKDGNMQVNEGKFDKEGNYTTPNGDIGHFDETGKFIPNELNPHEDGFYDEKGEFHEFGQTYIDEDGNVKQTGKGSYIDKDGNIVNADLSKGVLDENGNIVMPDGTVITPDGKVGYYDEDGNFVEGKNPYEEGYYDSQGNFIKEDGTVITPDGEIGNYDSHGNIIMPDGTVITPDGKVGYYDKDGNFVEGESPYKDGYYDAQGNFISEDGTVTTPDGKVGYYDENGVFHEGENPYEGGHYDAQGNFITDGGAIITPDGTVYDSQGNIISPDGTVTTPDGRVGYYDENGNFVEGESPYADGYYDSQGNFVKPDGTVISPDGKEGYYDEHGVFHEGINPNEGGYYDAQGNFIKEDGTVTPVTSPADGDPIQYDSQGNIITSDGTIITKDGKVISPDGTTVQGVVDSQGNVVLPNGTVITSDGKVGYYDKDGNFVEGESPYKDGYYDEDGNFITKESQYYDKDGNLVDGVNPDKDGYYDSEGNYHIKGDSDGYYDKDGNYHTSDGKVGYYDKDGNFIEGTNPYTNGYYDKDGNWHGEGDPQTGYFDKDGNFVEGENPYEGGFYDSEGNWHPSGSTEYIDKQGNVHKEGENAIGYVDNDGNFHLQGDSDGYYDSDGNYHTSDGKVGYYDKDGKFHEGKNPNKDGFYDSEGNWHPKGDSGYYDKDGNYHESIGDEKVGYYEKDGSFVEGTNPYKGGRYDSEGNWHPEGDSGYYDSEGNYHTSDGKVGYYDKDGKFHEGKNPNKEGYYDKDGNFVSFKDGQKKGYFDSEGNYKEGISPYKDGFYDNNGNWHPDGAEGYYDKQGTFHGKDGRKTYYDKDGKLKEGTNPYTDGYYDAEGNFHPFDKKGYFDSQGNWHGEDGKVGYYDKDGKFHEGKTNPYEDGYYDSDGNWHPYGESGYYDKDGVFHPDFIVDDKYRVGSPNYILYEGYFRNPAERKAHRLAGNTVQFSISQDNLSPIFIDTGIFVGQNALLQYDEAKDILHGIGLKTGNVFIQDNFSCMLIYEGRAIKLDKTSRVTIKDLREKLLDTKIQLIVGKSRIGGKYNFVESVETKQNIKVVVNDKQVNMRLPLATRNNEVLVPLSDFMDMFVYKVDIKDKKGIKEVTMKRSFKKGEDSTQSASYIRFRTDQLEFDIDINNSSNKEKFITPPTQIQVTTGAQKEIYIPAKMLPMLTDKNVYWDSNTFTLSFKDKPNSTSTVK